MNMTFENTRIYIETTYNVIEYVEGHHEYLNVEKTRSREFFKVEKHPKQTKIWIGCKSNAVSIQDKLNVANNMVNEMNNIMLV